MVRGLDLEPTARRAVEVKSLTQAQTALKQTQGCSPYKHTVVKSSKQPVMMLLQSDCTSVLSQAPINSVGLPARPPPKQVLISHACADP